MALKPGDEVKVDQCEQVDNFPFGMLANPDALEFSPDAFGPLPALAERKQDYIDALESDDLEVCNEEQFATKGSPLILHLQRKEEEVPPDPDVDKYIVKGWLKELSFYELESWLWFYYYHAAYAHIWPYPDYLDINGDVPFRGYPTEQNESGNHEPYHEAQYEASGSLIYPTYLNDENFYTEKITATISLTGGTETKTETKEYTAGYGATGGLAANDLVYVPDPTVGHNGSCSFSYKVQTFIDRNYYLANPGASYKVFAIWPPL